MFLRSCAAHFTFFTTCNDAVDTKHNLFFLACSGLLLDFKRKSALLRKTPAGRPDEKMHEARQDGPHARRRLVGSAWSQRQVAPREVAPGADVANCILLFGAFCNGEKRETKNDREAGSHARVAVVV